MEKNVQVLNQLLKYEFKRKVNAVGMPEIHGLCDAGEKAYGSAMFLSWKLDDGGYTCILLMLKAFVSLLKKQSIPSWSSWVVSRSQGYTEHIEKS